MHADLVDVLGTAIAQGAGDHQRAQVRAADTEVDHVGDRLAGGAAPLAAVEGVDHLGQVLEALVDGRHDILAVHLEAGGARQTQRGVQRRTVFGAIDMFTGQQALDALLDTGFARQIQQQLQGLALEALLGEIQTQPRGRAREGRHSVTPLRRILGEQVLQMHIGHLLLMMPRESLPGLGITTRRTCR